MAFASLAMYGKIDRVFLMSLCVYTFVHIHQCSHVCVILFAIWSYLFSENAFADCQRSSVGLGLHFRLFLVILGRESCWCQLKLTMKMQFVLITLLSLFHFLLLYFILKMEDSIPLRTELKSAIYCSDNLLL